MACAPNFYCSSLNSSQFNKEIVRTPNQVEVILFGQDANFLGRPLNYVGGTGDTGDTRLPAVMNIGYGNCFRSYS